MVNVHDLAALLPAEGKLLPCRRRPCPHCAGPCWGRAPSPAGSCPSCRPARAPAWSRSAAPIPNAPRLRGRARRPILTVRTGTYDEMLADDERGRGLRLHRAHHPPRADDRRRSKPASTCSARSRSAANHAAVMAMVDVRPAHRADAGRGVHVPLPPADPSSARADRRRRHRRGRARRRLLRVPQPARVRAGSSTRPRPAAASWTSAATRCPTPGRSPERPAARTWPSRPTVSARGTLGPTGIDEWAVADLTFPQGITASVRTAVRVADRPRSPSTARRACCSSTIPGPSAPANGS